MARLWKKFGGEPFLINPRLLSIFNPTGSKTKMARKKSSKKSTAKKSPRPRRSVAASKPVHRRKSRKPKKAYRTRIVMHGAKTATLINRRRRTRKNPVHRRRRSYRSNPSIPASIKGIFSKGNLKTVAFGAGGFVGTAFLEGFANNYVNTSSMKPSDPTIQKVVKYAVRIASAFAIGMVVSKTLGKDAGKNAYIGGATYVAVQAYTDFVLPMLNPASQTPNASAYLGRRTMGSQPMLGAYPQMGSYITNDTPERLRPESRF